MKKAYLILAAITSVTLFSCTSDEFVGNSPGTTDQSYGKEITFKSNAGKITRATQNTGTVAEMLDGHFKFYGVKNMTSAYVDAFKNYVAWNATTKSLSNPDGGEVDGDNKTQMNGWEYVGDGTAHHGTNSNQTIKFWDYSASDYHFVAGSPASSFTFNLAATGGDIATATVTGLAGHITANNVGGGGTAITTDPVYIADPEIVLKANYQQEVVFNFTRQQSFVRVGIFETIPGYSISSISFYPYEESSDAWGTTATDNITLVSKTAKYFRGSANGTATITYDWTVPTYSFAYNNSSLTESKNWKAGQLTGGVPATTSTEATIAKLYGTDLDMASATGYFAVIPSPSSLTAQPILIKCDYTLTAEDGNGEVINVKGATAAIPAAFTKWNPNTTYTYLFKISNNTNGTTGTPGTTDPEGLYPISFDAVVTATTDGTTQGTITTVSTPSITTYQEGSVTPTGIKYVKDKAIYFTAQNDETGALNALTALDNTSLAVGMVKVYSVAAGSTEADLILTRPTTGVETTIGSADKTINGQIIGSGDWASFTPTATGTYAIEYVTATTPAYSYKIIVVE